MAIIRKHGLLLFLLIAGVLLSALMFKTTGLHSDHTQILDKATKLVQTGEWTHYGNRSTKVGSIPGSFLTAASGLPMMLWYSPYAACAVILLFHLASLYFLFLSGRFVYGHFSILLLLVFYWINPWRVEQSELYNPAYLFLFSSVHLWTSLKMKTQSFWLTYFHVLVIGLCFQTHFSFIILALISLILFLTKQLKISWAGFAAGATTILLSLIPYILARLADTGQIEQKIDLAQSDAFIGRNFLYVYPVLKAVMYLFRMGSTYFGRHIFSEIRFDWIETSWLNTAVTYLFTAFIWILAAVTLYYIGKLIFHFFKFYSPKNTFRWNRKIEYGNDVRFYDYFWSLFLAVIIAAGLSPVEFNHWHFILCFPVIALFLILQLQNQDRVWDIAKGFVVIFLVWNVLAALGSRTHSYKNDYEQQFQEHYHSNK